MARRRAADEAAGRDQAPDALWAKPRRRVGTKVLLGVALLVLLAKIGSAQRPGAPPLKADCTTPAFALSATTVKQARPATYTIVGPDGVTYALGVDTATFQRDASGTWRPVALPGRQVIDAAPPKVMKGCRRTGLFGLPVPLGTHVVVLYRLAGDTATELSRQTIEVTEDGKPQPSATA